MTSNESERPRLPNLTPEQGPQRSRRSLRGSRRIRAYLFATLLAVGATTLFTTPVGDAVRNQTEELLSTVREATTNNEPEPAEQEEQIVQPAPSIEFDDSVFVDPRMVGLQPPWAFDGLLTFRGSPTRTFYGRGPVPDDPAVQWRFPPEGEGGLCRQSTVGSQTRTWCGLGWTGQSTLFRLDGRLWSVFGALDGAVHFLDGETGEELLPRFQTDDIIKGSVTIDPDGFPLVYTGSRDNQFRIIAFDNGDPRELWSLDAESVGETLWNNDWDGAGLVLEDFLIVGGENSRLHVIQLNRDWGDDGLVRVAPELIFSAPGWDAELLAAAGDDNVSIENSVAVSGDTVYFANSGGLVQGWDLAPLRNGGDPTRVFRYWVGDDVDATIVIDEEGFLYVGAEFERNNARSRELGQLFKLDPTQEGEDALVWSVQENQGVGTGIWSTPALHDGAVIFSSEGGRFRAVDQETGADLWNIDLRFHLWTSPVVVDDVLLMGDCFGTLHAFDASDLRSGEPDKLWELQLDDGCIESTPAVWEGNIVVGTRRGGVYGVRSAE